MQKKNRKSIVKIDKTAFEIPRHRISTADDSTSYSTSTFWKPKH